MTCSSGPSGGKTDTSFRDAEDTGVGGGGVFLGLGYVFSSVVQAGRDGGREGQRCPDHPVIHIIPCCMLLLLLLDQAWLCVCVACCCWHCLPLFSSKSG